MPSTIRPRTAVVDSVGHRLRADAAGSYLRMRAAGMPAGGVDVFTRSLEQQRYLYEHQPPRAAYPSLTAPHVDGRAMDLHTTSASGGYDPSAAHAWLTTGGYGGKRPQPGERLRAHAYGWFRTVPSERWHFEYDRGKDTKRSADLAARLKALGYRTLKAFQSAHGLAPDGVDGPLTWAQLLDDPTPVGLTDVLLRAATLNVEAERWGGGPYEDDAAFIVEDLRPSILFLQEAEEKARDEVREETGFKLWAHLYLAVAWDDEKWTHGDRLAMSLGTPYHGAVATQLERRGLSLVAASAHIRPADAFGSGVDTAAAKRADVAKVIAFLARHPRVVVGGDWNTPDVRPLMEAAGYQLATPWQPTTDQGRIHDAIFVRGLTVRGGSIVPTPTTDHHGLVANLTLPAPVPTN